MWKSKSPFLREILQWGPMNLNAGDETKVHFQILEGATASRCSTVAQKQKY
jgi:hypothetical protein